MFTINPINMHRGRASCTLFFYALASLRPAAAAQFRDNGEQRHNATQAPPGNQHHTRSISLNHRKRTLAPRGTA